MLDRKRLAVARLANCAAKHAAKQNYGTTNYSAVEVMLRQTLWSGFLLGDLFVEERNFRAPWLDLLTGIDELNALLMLKQSIDDAEVDSHDEVRKWTSEKLSTLIRIMERTAVAMQRDVYW